MRGKIRRNTIHIIFFSVLISLFFLNNLNFSHAIEQVEIFTLQGHGSKITSVAFSPDGRLAVSASGDKTVKLWDVQTGTPIWTFEGHKDDVTSVTFSPDGKYIASGSMDKTIKLWDVLSGKEIESFFGRIGTHGVSSIAYSPDGKYIVSGRGNGVIILLDARYGSPVWFVSEHNLDRHNDSVTSINFSRDGKYIVSGSVDKTIKLWEKEDNGRLKLLRSFVGHNNYITSVGFTPDGRFIVSGSYDKTIKLWDPSTGRNIWTFEGHNDVVTSLSVSPDSRYILSGSRDRTIKLWDLATGKMKLSLTGHLFWVNSVSFSPDGKYALSGSADMTVKLWDIIKEKEMKTFKGYSGWVHSLSFSPDNKYIASSGTFDTTIKFWDIKNGTLIWRTKEHGNTVFSVAFSPDGKYIASAGGDGNIKLWDAINGNFIKTFVGHKGIVTSISFSPDSRFIVSGGFDKLIFLWNVEGDNIAVSQGRHERRMRGIREGHILYGHKYEITSAIFSPDGRHIVFGDHEGKIILWDRERGNILSVFDGNDGINIHPVKTLCFSPDGRYIVSGSLDGFLIFWHRDSGRRVWQFKKIGVSVNSLSFSPDSKYVASAWADGSISLFEAENGKSIKELTGHKGVINSIEFSRDGQHISSGGNDGSVILWDVNSLKEIARFFSFYDGEWITVTGEGYYNSSLNGHKYLRIRKGKGVYSIDQFYDVFYRPDIVKAKLSGEDISGLITVTIDEAIKNPPPSVEITPLPGDINQPKAKVCYQIKSTGGGIGEVRLFHNGKLVYSDGFYRDISKTGSYKELVALSGKAIYEQMRGIKIAAKGEASPIQSKSKGDFFEECKEIDVVSGENTISVTAFNGQNTVQGYMKTITFVGKMPPEEPHLYILSIGIDKYRDSKINLKYAVKDARDMVDKIVKQAKTLYKTENIHFDTIFNENATKSNILNEITNLSQKIKSTDSFILFIAGHGVLLENQYYMLTHDFAGSINEHSLISSNELIEISKKIRSLNQLFILDTCHAGGVDYIVSGLYDARMSVLAKKMGLHIFASASSHQEALDGYKGNGLFTYSLLDGLNNNPSVDKNRDNIISLTELGQYVKRKTIEISGSIGHSQVPLIVNFGNDTKLYKLVR